MLLREAGFEPVLLPLSAIAPLDPAPPGTPLAGLVVTSRYAVPWLASHYSGSILPVLAVGEATAGALRAAGFADVRAGPGRATDLVGLAAALPRWAGKTFLYAAGRVRLPDLEATFADAGLPLRVVEVYDTVPAMPSDAELERARAGGPAQGAILLSRGQARAFERFAEGAGDVLGEDVALFCLSDAIALELSPQFGKNAVVAEAPRFVSLVDAIKNWSEGRD